MTRFALAAVLLAACGDDGGGSTQQDAAIDMMTNNNKVVAVTCPATPNATVMTTNTVDAYMPMNTPISVNGIVRFMISSDHDVTPNPIGTSDPGLVVAGGQTKCLQFKQAGTYGFFCTPHGFTGTITVN